MAYADMYATVLKDGDEDFFVVGDQDTEPQTKIGVSRLFDYVTKKVSILSSNTTLENKNAFYIVTANCTLTFPAGYEGLTIGVKVSAAPTSVYLLPSGSNAFEGGNPTLTASTIAEYCFVSGTWYKIR